MPVNDGNSVKNLHREESSAEKFVSKGPLQSAEANCAHDLDIHHEESSSFRHRPSRHVDLLRQNSSFSVEVLRHKSQSSIKFRRKPLVSPELGEQECAIWQQNGTGCCSKPLLRQSPCPSRHRPGLQGETSARFSPKAAIRLSTAHASQDTRRHTLLARRGSRSGEKRTERRLSMGRLVRPERRKAVPGWKPTT
jgi:hypothetical protein